MKRQGTLYHKIAEPENLRLAFHKAMKGKQGRPDVVHYRKNLDSKLRHLRNQLLAENVEVGNYRFFTVHDPKERRICAASFPERVLHHAIMNICEPSLESFAIYDSYACRKGKGLHRAITRAQDFSRNYEYYLKLDVYHYFDHINHQQLMYFLKRRFKDRKLLRLFREIRDSYSTEPGRGMPIGNLISQHLANFYLGYLDHYVKEELRVKPYLRYMDDLLFFSHDKSSLKNLFHKVNGFISEQLKLTLRTNRQLNRCSKGIPYLGFRVFPAAVRLSARSRIRFAEKFSCYEENVLNGTWDEKTLCRHMESLFGFVKSGNSCGFRKKILEKHGVLTV